MAKSHANIQQYFERIDYKGSATLTIDTLVAVHKAHVLAVPFENLDVQLGQAVSTDIESVFEKIVVRNRGGWCYEQNGVFGWALAAIGFEVTRIAANVMRQQTGDASHASHLCILVKDPESTQLFLADVGFGGSMTAPIPLTAECHEQSPFELRLEETDDGYWRFSEDSGEGRFGYDFKAESASEAQLAEKCDSLQSDPNSHFVLNLVAQRRFADHHRILRGRVLSTVTSSGTETVELQSAAELVSTLKDVFRLNVPGVADLWQ